MKHFKAIGVALMALFVLGIAATSAFATLPDVSIALGGAYPLHLNFADNGETATKLESTAGSTLTGKGFLLLLLAKELSSLGTYNTLFLNVVMGTKKCNTAGDKAGEVLLPENEYHVVFPSLSPLTLGIAFLVKETEITCETLKLKVKGCALANITDPKTATEEATLATGELTGSKGKNTLTEYDNAEGTAKVKCILETNFGTGFLQSDEVVGEAVHLLVLESKMFTISPI